MINIVFFSKEGKSSAKRTILTKIRQANDFSPLMVVLCSSITFRMVTIRGWAGSVKNDKE